MKIAKASAKSADRLAGLLEGDARVQVRKMFGHPAAFANGNLCVGTYGEELFVRLSEDDVAELSKTPGVRPFEPMPGRPMRQYLVLPPAMVSRPSAAKKWVTRSIEYALSLPPK